MDYEVIFEFDRILFVKVSEKLIQDYLDMVNDIEVQKYIRHTIRKYSMDEEIEWINQKLKDKAIIFSMIEKGTNEFIGNIELLHINNNIGELGIAITTGKQDNHYGQESIKRMIEYSFNDLKLDGLELDVYDFNLRGIKCYENVGFVKDSVNESEGEIHMILNK